MKTLALTLLAAISFTRLQAQDPIPFPNNNVHWMTLRGSWDDFGNSNSYGYIISPTEDTLLDGLAFQKLSLTLNYTTSYIFPGTTSADDTDIPLGTIAAIRVEDEKVYMRAFDPIVSEMTVTDYAPQYAGLPLDTTFLLYDFGLQVNDTVFYPIDHTPVMYVSMIDSVLLNDGIYHQRFHFYETGAVEQVWLEGIGSENGIFGAFLPVAASMSGSSWLECFKLGDTYVYGTDSCDFNLHETTAIHESTPETISCYVWENQIYIKNLPATMQARIYLFNVQGQRVFDSEIPDSKIISIPNLITGIYSAVIQVESGPTFSQLLKL